MDLQTNSLLQNMPVRHIISKVKTTGGDLKKQLKKLAEMNFNNFFILGK